MKKIISLILAVLLLAAIALPCFAYSEKQLDTADALYGLGLFLGYGKTYGLDNGLTRNEGIVLLVRMLGKEETATAENNTTPFTDVADFAEAHVGYAYKNGLVKGYSEKKFGGDDKLSDKQFCTLVLRALGYSDSGDNADFTYDGARNYAAMLGLVDSADENKNFTRGNVVEIFWKALNTKMKTGGCTLAEYLTNEGVFKSDDWLKAVDTQKNGRSEDAETGEKQTEDIDLGGIILPEDAKISFGGHEDDPAESGNESGTSGEETAEGGESGNTPSEPTQPSESGSPADDTGWGDVSWN